MIATLTASIPQYPTLDRAAPSSRERLSLRDGYFARRLFGSINWCRAPATPKPGPLLNRPLATSRPVSTGQKGRQRPRQGAPLRPFGYPGRAVEYAVSRPISFYRFPLTFEYIFVSPRQGCSPRSVGHPLRSTASLAASETIGDDFFEGLKEVAGTQARSPASVPASDLRDDLRQNRTNL